MKSFRKICKKLLSDLLKPGMALLLIAAALIIWFFYAFMKGPHEYDTLQKDAVASVEMAKFFNLTTQPTNTHT